MINLIIFFTFSQSCSKIRSCKHCSNLVFLICHKCKRCCCPECIWSKRCMIWGIVACKSGLKAMEIINVSLLPSFCDDSRCKSLWPKESIFSTGILWILRRSSICSSTAVLAELTSSAKSLALRSSLISSSRPSKSELCHRKSSKAHLENSKIM